MIPGSPLPPPSPKISKAVIPVAGLGTRMLPMSAVLPKCLFPLTDASGRCRPILHWLCDQARTAGVQEVAVVVSPGQHELIARYMKAACSGGDYSQADPPLPTLHYVIQDRPAGFGDAVLRAEPFVGRYPFLLLLGDHIYVTAPGQPSCVQQVAAAFSQHKPAAMVGMQAVPEAELPRVGVARGVPIPPTPQPTANAEPAPEHPATVYRCTDFVEKPTVQQARERLVTPALPEGQYLAHAGVYAFGSAIFDCLGATPPDAKGELQLADAQSLLLQKRPQEYLLCHIQGRAYDTGNPQGYAAAQAAMAQP